MADERQALLEALTKKLADDGKLVAAGFVALQRCVMSPEASESEVQDMRWAFFAGAQHIFASIMTVLEEGEEPTERDIARMDLIDAELEEWRAEVAAAGEVDRRWPQ